MSIFADLGDHAHNEALLLDVVRLYRVRILQNLACHSGLAAVVAVRQLAGCGQASVPE
jgi:hypothetical protein